MSGITSESRPASSRNRVRHRLGISGRHQSESAYESLEGWPDLCEAFVAGAIPQIPAWLVELIEAARDGGPSLGTPRPAGAGDKSAWVGAALESEAIALANLGEGGRNNELNRLAYMFGGHAANGWIDRDEVCAAMHWACEQNGYLDSPHPSDGPRQFEKTFNSGWNSGFRRPTSGPAEPVLINIESLEK